MKSYRSDNGTAVEDPTGPWMKAAEVDAALGEARRAMFEVLDILNPLLPPKGADRGGAVERAFDAALKAVSRLRSIEDSGRVMRCEGGTTG